MMVKGTLCGVLSLCLVSCTSEPDLPDLDDGAFALGDTAIQVRDSGDWQEYDCSYSCWRKRYFWVDLAVRDDDYEKQVAVVWTKDAWDTYEVAYASYEGELGGGREAWGVDVFIGAFSGPNRALEVEYAAYVKMAGATHWEPYNNHHVFGRVTRNDPVTLLESEVGYEADAGGVLSGTVRVFNLAYDKQVTILYTKDGWLTAGEAEAWWVAGGDWAFRIEGLGTDVLPDTVEFAVRYRAAGEEHWDNNDGYDYTHRMQPVVNVSGPYGEVGEPLSGTVAASAYVMTDIPVQRIDVRVDDEAWRKGGSSQPSRYVELSTVDLADGAHAVEFRAVLEGGYGATGTGSFDVLNLLSPLGAWTPDFGELDGTDSSGWSEGFAVAASGELFFQWNEPYPYDGDPFRGIVRFPAYGTDATPVAFEPLPSEDYYTPSPQKLAVDGEGRVYAVSSYPWSVWRWTAAGDIDATFGDDGRIDFGMAFDGHYLDNIEDIALGGGYLWVTGRCPQWVETCNDVVVRFDESGAFDAMIDMPLPSSGSLYYGDFGAAAYANDALWVLGRGVIASFGPSDDAELAVLDVIELPEALYLPAEDLAVSAAGQLFVLGYDAVAVLNEAGELLTRWRLYSNTGLPGSVQSPRQIQVLPDGNIGILDGQEARVVSFDDVLAH